MKSNLSNKWLAIVNPAAGGGKAGKQWPKIAARLKDAGISFEAVSTSAPGDAVRLIREGIEKGYRHLFAVGGDGTHHEAVNGILQQKHIDPQLITYALLPVGTGNDWIKTYQIPRNPEAWIRMIKKGHTRLQDIGRLRYRGEKGSEIRYFANVAGLAYDGFVAKEMFHKKSSFIPGKIQYFLMVLACLFKYKLIPARVFYDGQQSEELFYTINVGICSYSGGGMQLVPHAIPDDGLLALTMAGPISKMGVLLNSYRFYTASIGSHPKVSTVQASRIRIEAAGDTPLLLEADGEFLGETPVEIEILEKVLKVVVPE